MPLCDTCFHGSQHKLQMQPYYKDQNNLCREKGSVKQKNSSLMSYAVEVFVSPVVLTCAILSKWKPSSSKHISSLNKDSV